MRTFPSDEQLKRWRNRCKPDEPVAQTDERYHGGILGLRGEDHIAPMLDCIELAERDSCQLFSGYIGTGKSTELLRLRSMLEARGYVVLYRSADSYHDLGHELEIEALLVLLAGAFGEATAELVGQEVIKDGYWSRFRTFVDREVKIGTGAKVSGADLKLELGHGRPLWLKIKDALASSLSKLKQDAHQFIVQCVAHLQQRHQHAKGVVFIFDSLERLRGPEDRFRPIMDSALRVFEQYADFLRLPSCHTIYTVPPYLEFLSRGTADRYDRPLTVLPSIKVLGPGPAVTPHPAGVEQLVQLVGKRVELDEVFGDRLDLLERLVIHSAGHLKELLRMLGELLLDARRGGLPPDDDAVDKVLNRFRERARRSIRVEGLPLLELVRTTSSLDRIGQDQLPLLAHYMDQLLVLSYENGERWYQVHPLVREHVARLARESASDAESDQAERP
jgi:hypothetical protein